MAEIKECTQCKKLTKYVCERCGNTYYCSMLCLARDYSRHRYTCIPFPEPKPRPNTFMKEAVKSMDATKLNVPSCAPPPGHYRPNVFVNSILKSNNYTEEELILLRRELNENPIPLPKCTPPKPRPNALVNMNLAALKSHPNQNYSDIIKQINEIVFQEPTAEHHNCPTVIIPQTQTTQTEIKHKSRIEQKIIGTDNKKINISSVTAEINKIKFEEPNIKLEEQIINTDQEINKQNITRSNAIVNMYPAALKSHPNQNGSDIAKEINEIEFQEPTAEHQNCPTVIIPKTQSTQTEIKHKSRMEQKINGTDNKTNNISSVTAEINKIKFEEQNVKLEEQIINTDQEIHKQNITWYEQKAKKTVAKQSTVNHQRNIMKDRYHNVETIPQTKATQNYNEQQSYIQKEKNGTDKGINYTPISAEKINKITSQIQNKDNGKNYTPSVAEEIKLVISLIQKAENGTETAKQVVRLMDPPFQLKTVPLDAKTVKVRILSTELLEYGFISCIWLRYNGHLRETMSLLENFKATESSYSPVKGEYCLALLEGKWYRAQCRNVNTTEVFRIRYLDLAKEDIVSSKELHPYTCECTNLCATFFCCIQDFKNILPGQHLEFVQNWIRENDNVIIVKVLKRLKNIIVVRIPALFKAMTEANIIPIGNEEKDNSA